MVWLEWLGGMVLFAFLFRAGFSTIFPLLIWVPFLAGEHQWGFVLGLVACFLAGMGLNESSSFLHEDVVLGLGSALIGLWFFSLFSLVDLEAVVFPVLSVFTLFFLCKLFVSNRKGLVGALLAFGMGWFLLKEWVVPLALPSFLVGFWGSTLNMHSLYENPSRLRRVGDAFLGCALGVLPGLGPGLMGALWFSHRASRVMVISNLVFSVGFIALSGKVRSVAAHALGGMLLPDWSTLGVWLVVGVFFSHALLRVLPSVPFVFSSRVETGVQLLGVLFWGSFASVLVVGMGFCLRRFLEEMDAPLSVSALFLVPSILWFYAGY